MLLHTRNALFIYLMIDTQVWASMHRYRDVIMATMASQITNLTIVYSIQRWSKQTSKLRVTGLCDGDSSVTGEFPAQRATHHSIIGCKVSIRLNQTRPAHTYYFCRELVIILICWKYPCAYLPSTTDLKCAIDIIFHQHAPLFSYRKRKCVLLKY